MGVALGMEYHLQHNHYPPVPLSMVPVCEQAIDYANAGMWNKEIPMPEGITYKDRDTAPTYAIIEQHHLDFWLEDQEEY